MNILSEHDVKGAIPSHEEMEELIDREETMKEEYDEEMRKRKESFKIKASVISAVEDLKRDLDGLQTTVISYTDILKWIDSSGGKHGISRADAETIADLLAHKYKITVR